MFISSTVISVTFRCINFAIIIFLILYIFKRSLLKGILQAMDEKNKEQEQLKTAIESLHNKQIALALERNKQNEVYTQLSEKMNIWQQKTTSHSLQQKKELEELEKKLIRLHHVRIEEIQQKQLIKKVIPQVFNQATTTLKKEFSTEEKGKVFLTNLINTMEKTIHD